MNQTAVANTVTVSGTVGSTRIVAMNDNDQIVVEDDTAGRSPSAPGRVPFTLANGLIGSPSVITPTGIIAIPENSTVYPAAYRNNLLFTAWNDGTIHRVILSGPDFTLLGTSSIAYNGGQDAGRSTQFDARRGRIRIRVQRQWHFQSGPAVEPQACSSSSVCRNYPHCQPIPVKHLADPLTVCCRVTR